MLGQRIGHYQIVRHLGGGGMGEVYEAIHEQLGRRAAIKVLRPHLAADAQVMARFLNEGRAASVVDHPGIVQILELGQLDGGAPYIVMELLRGETLRARMQRTDGRLPAALSLRIIRQMGDVLVVAHERGIVHRDLKPENLMLVPDPAAEGGERTKLLDFGIAKLTEGLLHGGKLRTQTGALLGTPVYMAPEQCQGAARATDRSDVYAAGVMLYEMLAGHLPIGGEGLVDLMVGHMVAAPIPLRQRDPTIPDGLAALVHRMLAKNPEERPAMKEVVASVDAFLHAGAGHVQPPTSGPAMAPAGHANPAMAGQAPRTRGTQTITFGWRTLIVGAIAALATGVIVTSAFVSGPEAAAPGEGTATISPADAAAAALPVAPAPQAVTPENPAIATPDTTAPQPPDTTAPQPRDTAAPQRPARRREAPAREQPAPPFRPHQVWRGSFLAEAGSGSRVCGKGRSTAMLLIVAVKKGVVDAMLDFEHPSSGHAGSYHLSGTYQPDRRRILFRTGKWIELDVHDNDDKADFVAVGMDGQVAADGETFSGRMTASPCTTFHLHEGK